MITPGQRYRLVGEPDIYEVTDVSRTHVSLQSITDASELAICEIARFKKGLGGSRLAACSGECMTILTRGEIAALKWEAEQMRKPEAVRFTATEVLNLIESYEAAVRAFEDLRAHQEFRALYTGADRRQTDERRAEERMAQTVENMAGFAAEVALAKKEGA